MPSVARQPRCSTPRWPEEVVAVDAQTAKDWGRPCVSKNGGLEDLRRIDQGGGLVHSAVKNKYSTQV